LFLIFFAAFSVNAPGVAKNADSPQKENNDRQDKNHVRHFLCTCSVFFEKLVSQIQQTPPTRASSMEWTFSFCKFIFLSNDSAAHPPG